MKTSFFIALFFLFLPILVFTQQESSEKITCKKLISDHLSSCPRCEAGEKCEVRKDLLDFCSSKEQELIVVDPGPADCGCPTYGYSYPRNSVYYSNYYQPYYDGYYYTGPSYQYGYGYVVNAGFSGGYYLGASFGISGGYYGRGGCYNRGGFYGGGGYPVNGGHHNNGSYYGNGGHQGNGGNNTRVHYGSRRGGG